MDVREGIGVGVGLVVGAVIVTLQTCIRLLSLSAKGSKIYNRLCARSKLTALT